MDAIKLRIFMYIMLLGQLCFGVIIIFATCYIDDVAKYAPDQIGILGWLLFASVFTDNAVIMGFVNWLFIVIFITVPLTILFLFVLSYYESMKKTNKIN